jgi:hypothetical protein
MMMMMMMWQPSPRCYAIRWVAHEPSCHGPSAMGYR